MRQIFSSTDAYKFLKVEQYFENYRDWERLENVDSHSFEPNTKTLTLRFIKSDNNPCSIVIQFPQKDTFRFRFNPEKIEFATNIETATATEPEDKYTGRNSRSVVQDKFDDLTRLLDIREPFNIIVDDHSDRIELVTQGEDNLPAMKMVVSHTPFVIQVFNLTQGDEFLVWQTAPTPIYYTPNGDEDYAIILAVKKPGTAEYIGFGEQGGQSLSKNTAQMNYFNFDNMRYRQVYDRGPLDAREPLYHSDPFFFEFNGVPEKNSVNGIFIDNTGQLFVDIGYMNSSRYMIGTRFGDLDYYFFMGNYPAQVIDSFTSIVGKSRLKPRYSLGYHQGCYGYESGGSLKWVVDKYREYQIPLDGLHVDVDIQNKYQTFTIANHFPDPFPNPSSMFQYLKDRGVKCSTNITPVISREDQNYSTYIEARDNNYFVIDNRYEPDNPESKVYQLYGGGNEFRPNHYYPYDNPEGFNSGQPYIGGVYYGEDINGNPLRTSGHYPDLGRKEVREWWGSQYQYLFDQGIEMIWQDMTTPAIHEVRGDMKGFPFRLYVTDNSLSGSTPRLTQAIKVWNLYSYNLHKATYHGLDSLEGRKNKRNFIIGRGSFTGSHRWAGLWTGDNSSDWEFLKMNVSQVLSLGMCGVSISGQDIGGFEASYNHGKWASPELLIRWTAAGAFLPWFRNHYRRKGTKEFQEPFMYVEWFNQYQGGNLPEPQNWYLQNLYRLVLPICKHYIELRYRLLQLFYDAMFENTINGMPICRPLFFNDPSDKSLYHDKESFLSNQFFVGKDLLIAPVLEPQEPLLGSKNDGRRDVYLPSGSNWYCFMDNKKPLLAAIEGGTTVRDFNAHLNIDNNHINFIVPIYVREGAIIPTIELEQYVGQLNQEGKPNPITLNIYPGKIGEYTMYLDDGISRSSARSRWTEYEDTNPQDYGIDEQAGDEYRQTQITHSYIGIGQKTRQIKVERIHDQYTPRLENNFFVAVLHDLFETKGNSGCLQTVHVAGQEVQLLTGGTPEQRSNDLRASSSNAWYYNENINISFIKVFDDSPSITITAEYF